jgi:ADP-ribosylglycohydrolase
MHDALDTRDLISDEVAQLRESGHELAPTAELDRLIEGSERRSAALDRAYEELLCSPLRQDWPYYEPSSLDEIVASLPDKLPEPEVSGDVVADHVLGAWLGRCAGCNLGKPVEGHGWNRDKLRRYLENAGAYPITDYLPVLDPMPEGMEFDPSWAVASRGRVRGMARDDDTDYTILGLHVLEKYGFGFNTAQVGDEWLGLIPFTKTYTAERVAYRNLVFGLAPPLTATFQNPYREWIGAMIRGDAFGYVSPGRPWRAAELAYRDAALSHTANGIYGEMWAAALIAASFASSSAREALEISLGVVPPRSRLFQALEAQLALFGSGASWEDAMGEVDASLGHYHWVHTINNAAVVAAALLWGDGDFARCVGYAVEAGLDTDCTGATAGSVFGALHGTAALPENFVRPLEDTIHSAIFGYDGSRISDLAARTVMLAGQNS